MNAPGVAYGLRTFHGVPPDRVWVQFAGPDGSLRGLGTLLGHYVLHGVVTWALVRLDAGVQICVKPAHLAHATNVAVLPARREWPIDIPPPPRPWGDPDCRHPEPAA